MNLVVLQQLNEAYDKVKKEYSADFLKFRTIDTSETFNTTPQSNAAEATKLILEVFQSKLDKLQC